MPPERSGKPWSRPSRTRLQDRGSSPTSCSLTAATSTGCRSMSGASCPTTSNPGGSRFGPTWRGRPAESMTLRQPPVSTMIPSELAELLEPLERFESIRRHAVKLGPRLADLSYANPYGGPQAAARATIRTALDDERSLDLQYTPFGGQTLSRRAVADHLRSVTGQAFTFSDIVLTPGAMAALQL